ncbi:BRCA1 protein, partial [Turnix velox]|nr:BRCA1 protein [Turnix velox]
MDSSVVAVGDVQNVLWAMQKNLECPICLDVIKEPVSTKCDHVFCSFCMFELFSKKKKGVIRCPLCKTEVTKRSLKENSRFKQLIEGLLETIHAFELDTGVKFLNYQYFPKTCTETTDAKFHSKESSVIQSKGFRNREKGAKENGQENCSLVFPCNVFLYIKFKGYSLRNKTQKCNSAKGIYIEFGKICCRSKQIEFISKDALQISPREKPEELESAKKRNEYSCSTLPDKQGDKEGILPNVRGQSDSSKKGLSEKCVRSITEFAKPDQEDMTKYQCSPLNVAVELLTEQCDRIDNASPLNNGDMSVFKPTEEMDTEQIQCHNKSKEFNFRDSSKSRMDKSKEIDTIVQNVEAVEIHEPVNESGPEEELPLEKPLQLETPPSATMDQISRKRLKRSIQKVNEWLSKSDEILSSSSSQDDSSGAADVSGDGHACLSDKDSCISEKTDPMVNCMEIAEVEGNKRMSKQAAEIIKDKIFGKTYRRERKSSPVVLRDILPTVKKEVTAANSKSEGRLKRKRKTVQVLQPEDFILKKDKEDVVGCPQSVNRCPQDTVKKRCDENSAVGESCLPDNREDNTLAGAEEGGGSTSEKATEKVHGKHFYGDLEQNNSDWKRTKRSSVAKNCRHSTRSMCTLQLVVDRTSVSPDPAEPQIDSYPSSEETRKADSEQKQVRRSRRLQLLSEEIAKERGKGEVIKRVRKSAPDTDSQGETLENAFLLQSPSAAVVQTASLLAEEIPQSDDTCLQDNGHDKQSVPREFRTEKFPMAKNVLEISKEAEDSELDTQALRNIFRHSKRQSFSLYPRPTKVCAVEDATSEALKISLPDQVENKHNECSKTERKTTVESLSRPCEEEKLKSYESVCVSPVTCFESSSDCVCTGGHQEDISQLANGENLTAIKIGVAGAEDKNRSEKGEQRNEKTESELKHSPVKNNKIQTDAGDCIFTRTDLNTVDEIYFSTASNQAGNNGVVDSKGPTLCCQSRSTGLLDQLDCPATCQQKLTEFSLEVTEKSSKREGKQVKGNEEQAMQTESTEMSECLVTEEPFPGNSDFAGLSETPDGLLCSSDGTEENNSFCESDRRERSAVFVKSDSTLIKEPQNRNIGSKQRSKGIRRSRRRVQKLQTSDEESSEDEDFPCLQTLISGKSQLNNQGQSVGESSVSPSVTLLHKGSPGDNNMQKMPVVSLSSECVSPSQESECSVNLFSSQSNLSEESVDGAQELMKPLVQGHESKQASNGNESKETVQSCDGGLKRSQTNFRDECLGTNKNFYLCSYLVCEASGYDTETSNAEDSCGPFSQGEILTTQQKNSMQNNLKKLQQEMAVLEAALKQDGCHNNELPVHGKLPHSSCEGTPEIEQMRQDKGFSANEQKPGTRPSSTSVLCLRIMPESPNNSSSSAGPRSTKATNSSAVAHSASKSCVQDCQSRRSVCFPVSSLHNAAGQENTASVVVTNPKEMSIVASGLNKTEHLMVQKFARKTHSTLSNHITEETTHVIMKTDEELVCERTLKYFLGIAGGKWVVSYQCNVLSLLTSIFLFQVNFEVRGDVINGRNHQGPKRARQSLTEKIFKGFEICCYGPFTDMTTEHLEWMVELCGASVVKQLHLLGHTANSTAVVVVQPDAWMENTNYREIQPKNNVAMVSREWVLDSVACYERQELDTYLLV